MPLADALPGERHDVPVDDIADAFQVPGHLEHGHGPPGLRFRELCCGKPGDIEAYMAVEQVYQVVLALDRCNGRRIVALEGLDRVDQHFTHDVRRPEHFPRRLSQCKRRRREHVFIEVHGAELLVRRLVRHDFQD